MLASTRQFAPVSSLCAERKKERKQTRQTRDGTRTGSPPARAGFWKDDQGDRWGSPAPDKGHDRLAARCTVDSQLHWRSHLSLATCLQLRPVQQVFSSRWVRFSFFASFSFLVHSDQQEITFIHDLCVREIFINQQEITTLTVIWARQLVSPQPKLGPVP